MSRGVMRGGGRRFQGKAERAEKTEKTERAEKAERTERIKGKGLMEVVYGLPAKHREGYCRTCFPMKDSKLGNSAMNWWWQCIGALQRGLSMSVMD